MAKQGNEQVETEEEKKQEYQERADKILKFIIAANVSADEAKEILSIDISSWNQNRQFKSGVITAEQAMGFTGRQLLNLRKLRDDKFDELFKDDKVFSRLVKDAEKAKVDREDIINKAMKVFEKATNLTISWQEALRSTIERELSALDINYLRNNRQLVIENMAQNLTKAKPEKGFSSNSVELSNRDGSLPRLLDSIRMENINKIIQDNQLSNTEIGERVMQFIAEQQLDAESLKSLGFSEEQIRPFNPATVTDLGKEGAIFFSKSPLKGKDTELAYAGNPKLMDKLTDKQLTSLIGLDPEGFAAILKGSGKLAREYKGELYTQKIVGPEEVKKFEEKLARYGINDSYLSGIAGRIALFLDVNNEKVKSEKLLEKLFIDKAIEEVDQNAGLYKVKPETLRKMSTVQLLAIRNINPDSFDEYVFSEENLQKATKVRGEDKTFAERHLSGKLLQSVDKEAGERLGKNAQLIVSPDGKVEHKIEGTKVVESKVAAFKRRREAEAKTAASGERKR